MMKDIYGKEVVSGDILVEGHEEFCYIFIVENNIPVLKARHGYEEINRFTTKDIVELDSKVQRKIVEGELPSFMNKYYKNMLKKMVEIKSDSLMKIVNSDLCKVFKKFINEDYECVAFTDQLSEDSKLTAYFFDEEIKVEADGEVLI